MNKFVIGIYCLISFISIPFFPASALSDENYDNQTGHSRVILHSDIIGRYNPDGLILISGGDYRYIYRMSDNNKIEEAYAQGGISGGVSPSCGLVSAHFEWMPARFMQLRWSYAISAYFGVNGALLSFDSAEAEYGKNVIDERSGEEESGFGHQLMFQPTLRAKIGSIILRNQSDIAYFLFDGSGPYFYEPGYDTLLKNGDTLLANRTQLLFEAWKGKGESILLVGPVYEVTHAVGAGLTRQWTGALFYWTPIDLFSMNNSRIYAAVGLNLEDRNRQHEIFYMIGYGFDIN